MPTPRAVPHSGPICQTDGCNRTGKIIVQCNADQILICLYCADKVREWFPQVPILMPNQSRVTHRENMLYNGVKDETKNPMPYWIPFREEDWQD